MVLEVIYVVRHGFRMNWVVDPTTGVYHTATPTPTGIASDPALASYGVDQAHELAAKVVTLEPPVDVVYSSPFYRCLQTVRPSVRALVASGQLGKGGELVRVENGIGEFFGTARFEHPRPADVAVLQSHFPGMITSEHRYSIRPSGNGETIGDLHDRHAYALHTIVKELDEHPSQPRAVLMCTHAAAMICIGRTLTGNMPEDMNEEDFRCGTCSLSKYVRRKQGTDTVYEEVAKWDEAEPERLPRLDWKNGKGVMGGWDCEINGDCSFLKNGEERTWLFSQARDIPAAEFANSKSKQMHHVEDIKAHGKMNGLPASSNSA